MTDNNTKLYKKILQDLIESASPEHQPGLELAISIMDASWKSHSIYELVENKASTAFRSIETATNVSKGHLKP